MTISNPQRFLIPTKLHKPLLTDGFIHRERLHDLFSYRDHDRLIWICAPSGSGKTSALVDYLTTIEDAFSWYSLNDTDNETNIFFSYLLKACQSFFDTTDLLTPLLNGQNAHVDYLIATLVERFSLFDKPAILAFDDWHVITNDTIQESFQRLLEHIPPNVKLFINSRNRCPWPNRHLAIVRQWLREVTAPEMAFTISEGTRLFHGYESVDDINKLIVQLDGWAAGLKMVAISQSGPEVSNARLLHGEFSFDAYFKAEVFSYLTDDFKTALLRTSVLERFNRETLTALVPGIDADYFVQELIARQLFVVRLDEDNQWFRLHPLFSDFLSSQRDQIPELTQQCYELAACHCLTNELDDEALIYALRSQSLDILETVLINAGNRLVQAGYHRLLNQAFLAFTEDGLIDRFDLALFFAWFRFKVQCQSPVIIGHFIERAFLTLASPNERQKQRYYTIRCNLAFEQENIAGADSYFQQLHITTPDEIRAEHLDLPLSEKRDLIYLLSIAAELEQNKGNIPQAIVYHEMEQKMAAKLGVPPSTWNIHQLAAIYFSQGKFSLAQQWFEFGLNLNQQSGAQHSVSSWCMNVSMAEIALDDIRHDRVKYYCDQAEQRAILYQNEDWSMVPVSIQLRSTLLKAEPATYIVTKLMSLLKNRRFHSHSKAQGDAALIQYWKSISDQTALTAWLEQASSTSLSVPVIRLPDYLNRLNTYRVHWYLATMRCGELSLSLLNLLRRDVNDSADQSFIFISLQLRMVLCGWLFQLGKTNEAIAHLNQCYTSFYLFNSIATALEDFRFFDDYIDDTNDLKLSAEATSLIERLRLLRKQYRTTSLPAAVSAIPLTPKEWQVLQKIGNGKSNLSIAGELFISEGTVKSHINRLYRKLGVDNRRQAIEFFTSINQ